jgi:hypothetical protein
VAQKKEWAEIGMGYRKFFSNFLRFGVQKSKDFDIFKLDLNWIQTVINSN